MRRLYRGSAVGLLALLLMVSGGAASARNPETVSGPAEAVDARTLRIGPHVIRLKGIAVPDLPDPLAYESVGWLHRHVREKIIYCHMDPLPGAQRAGGGASPETGLAVRPGVRPGVCEFAGLDIAALMVEAGYAMDCARESGGRYRIQQGRAAAQISAGHQGQPQGLHGRFTSPAGCAGKANR